MHQRAVAVLLLGLAVLLSGCMTLNVRADLHRDKSMDLSIGVESQYELVRNALETQLNEQFNSSPTLSESDNSFSYSWEDVRPPQIDGATTNNFTEMLEWNLSHDYTFPASYVYRLEFEGEGLNMSGMEELGGTGEGSMGSSMFGDGLSSLGFNLYLDPFGTIVDTNGVETDTGAVKFDLLKDKTYYIEFKDPVWNAWMANMGGPACQEQWSCGEWSACTNGTKTRDCTASKTCENYLYRPKETTTCGAGTESGLDLGDSSLGETGYGFDSCYRSSPSFIGTPFDVDSWSFSTADSIELQFSMDDYALEERATLREVTMSFEDRNITASVDRSLTPGSTTNVTVGGMEGLAAGDCPSATVFVTYDTPSETGVTEASFTDLEGEVPG